MTARTLAGAALVAIGALVCVRLGFWQISRLHEKQAINARLRAALAAPPVPFAGVSDTAAVPVERRVRATGAYDERRVVLLSGRAHGGTPGVHVATPLVLADGRAVMVDRGWLASNDAMDAHPEDHPEPGVHSVTGLARALPRGAGGSRWLRLAGPDTLARWSARTLDLDSLGARLPYVLAPFVLIALPDSGAPAAPGAPLREPPQAANEMEHLSYAIQWFSFAVILVGGAYAVSRRRRGPDPNAPDAIPEPPR